jgi:group I intron endonuclease
MRIFKSHPLLKLVNSYLIDSSQPSNISYAWNFGSLLAVCLIIQILSGVTLAMHYNPSIAEGFNSIEHIMKDVNNGWLIRYLHSNTASYFFLLVYLHIGRGIYYGSFKGSRTLVWIVGTIIIIAMIATGFLGFIKYSPKWYGYIIYFNKNYSSQDIPRMDHLRLNSDICNKGKHVNKRFFSTDCRVNNGASLVVLEFIEENNLNPIIIYENLNDQITKNKIKRDSDNISGIYLIFNKITKDYYIGSASTNKIYSRFYRHLVNFSGSKIVKLAVKKYGLNSFAFIILELFPEEVNVENNKRLIDLEDFYIKSLLPNYNILTEAGSSFGYKHTEITRIRMKTNYSEERRKAVGNLNRGRTLSEETKAKMKTKALARIEPRVLSKEFLGTIKKNSKAIVLYNLSNNTVYGEYNSISEASRSLNCGDKTIRRALKTEKQILLRRWIVKYK